MIRITPEPTFDATVGLSVPGAEYPAPVQFTFVHLGRKALQEWMDRDKGADTKRTDAEFFAEVVRGWAGVLDEAGEPVPYTAQALAQLLDAYPVAHLELLKGYLDAYGEAARKNSERRPARS